MEFKEFFDITKNNIDLKKLKEENLSSETLKKIKELEPTFFTRELLQEKKTLGELFLDYDTARIYENKEETDSHDTASFELYNKIDSKINTIYRDAHAKYIEYRDNVEKEKGEKNEYTPSQRLDLAMNYYKTQLEEEADTIVQEFIRRRIKDIQKIKDLQQIKNDDSNNLRIFEILSQYQY